MNTTPTAQPRTNRPANRPQGRFGRAMAFAFLVGASFLVGIGCIGSVDDVCAEGDDCDCDGIGRCALECEGPGCDFECDGVGSCDLFCDDGDCTATVEGQGSLTLDCPGGGCEVACLNTGSCEITSCDGGGCIMYCRAIGECSCPDGNCEFR